MLFSTFVRRAGLCICSLVLLSASAAMAQLSGTYTIAPGGGHYTSIANAVSNLQSVGMSGPVVFELDPSYAGETYPITLPAIATANGTNTITIRPAVNVATPLSMAGGSNRIFTITGNYYKIDGRPGGTGSSRMLNLSSTNTGSQTVYIGSTANHCHLKYCNITGVNRSVTIYTGGIVLINGADNDTVSHCEISSGATLAAYGVFVSGTYSGTSDSCAVMNCDIHDIAFNNGGMISFHLYSNAGTISGNSLYETSAKTIDTSITLRSIYCQGTNHTISGNYIGGSQPYCGGSYTVYNGVGNKSFYGISSNTTGHTISGNKISKIKLEGALEGVGIFAGIYVNNVSASITGNTIGAETGVDSIVFSQVNTLEGAMYGILGSQGTISDNKVGALKTELVAGGAGAGIFRLHGIWTGSATVSNNLVGSLTTANSIHQTSTSTAAINGIYATDIGATVTGNTIANITDASTSNTVCKSSAKSGLEWP